MGFPSQGMEGVYRNHISDVQRFFNSKHFKRYKIYNLCVERTYDPDQFFRVSHKFKFQDHMPPVFTYLNEFCKDVA